MIERYELERYGVVNFWIWGNETFEIPEGHHYLTGNNGMGKTTLLNSVFTPMLDGITREEYLDSAANDKKSLTALLVGPSTDEDRKSVMAKEKEGYIWVEFRKGDEYLTSVLALSKGVAPKVTKKFFCFKNKRAHIDFSFFDEEGKSLLVRDFKKQLSQNGLLQFETSRNKEYQQYISSNLYGFESVDQLIDVTNLIRMMRSPQLTGKDAGLRDVLGTMKNSLPSIDSDRIDDVRNNYERIKRARIDLDNKIKICEQVRQVYEIQEANKNYYLRAKANEIRLSMNSEEEKSKNLSEKKKDIEDLDRKRVELKESSDNIRSKVEAAKDKKRDFARGDANRVDELNNKREAKKRILEEINVSKNRLEKFRKTEKDRLNRLRDRKEDLSYDMKEKDRLEEESLSKSESEELNIFINDSRPGDKLGNIDIAINDIGSLQSKIINIEDLKKSIDNKKDGLCKEKEVEANLSNLLEEIRLDKKEYLLLAHTNYLSIKNNLIKTPEEEEKFKVFDEDFYDFLFNRFLSEKGEEKGSLSNRRKDLEKKLKDLEDIDYKTFPQDDRLLRNRKEFNSTSKPLYELIDFKNNIDIKTKATIEAVLEEMGLLNAINNTNFKGVYSDKTILVEDRDFKHQDNLSNYLYSKSNEINNYLKSIAVFKNKDLLGKNIGISLDGYFRGNSLEGYACKEQVEFIGAEERKQRIEREKNLVRKNISDLQIEIGKIDQSVKEIKNSYSSISKKVKNKISNMEKSEMNTAAKLAISKKNIEDMKSIISGQEEEISKANKDLAESIDQLRLPRDIDYKACDEIRSYFLGLKKTVVELARVGEKIVASEKAISQAQEDLEIIREDIEKEESESKRLSEKREELDRDIKNLEEIIREIEERHGSDIKSIIERLSKEIADGEKELKEIMIKSEKLAAKLGASKKDEENLLKELTKISESKKVLEDEFEKLSLFYGEKKDFEEVLAQPRANKPTITPYSYFADHSDNNYKQFQDTMLRTSYRPNYKEFRLKNNTHTIGVFSKAGTRDKIYTLKEVLNDLERDRVEAENILERDDGDFKRKIINSRLFAAYSSFIEKANRNVDKISEKIERITENDGFKLRLLWKPNYKLKFRTKSADEMLDIIVNHKASTEDERNILIAWLEEKIEEAALDKNIGDVEKIFDYREWFDFSLQIYRDNRWSNFKGSGLSGGQKFKVFFTPLLATMDVLLEKGAPFAPRLITLDEAFQSIDDYNVDILMELLYSLGFNWIIASHNSSLYTPSMGSVLVTKILDSSGIENDILSPDMFGVSLEGKRRFDIEYFFDKENADQGTFLW